jgi:hypothetical protein
MQSKDDIEKLRKAGVLSKKSSNELEKSGGVSKKRTTIKRVLKTADGKWVIPTLYYRGGKNTRPSKKQTELTNKVNKLIETYTTARSNA